MCKIELVLPRSGLNSEVVSIESISIPLVVKFLKDGKKY